jgi:Spy/CpxP family protein refolding chaperone
MRPDAGGPEMAGGPGFGGGPDFSFEQGDEVEAMEGPEDGAADSDDDGADGAEFGGGPGFDWGPEAFGPSRGPGGFERMGPPQWGLPSGEALQAVLGLVDQQVQTLRQLQREKVRKSEEAQSQLRQEQVVLMDLLEQEDPDGTELVAAVKSIHALRKQVGEIQKDFQAKMAAVLNDEQRGKLQSVQEERQIPRAMQEAAMFNLIRPMGPAPRPEE